MEGMQDMVNSLVDAIRDMKVERVPPPVSYTGRGNLNEFFISFERYAASLYKDDFASYLQILPSFLDGESKNIVLSFGTGANYQVVKERLRRESNKRTLGSNNFTDFFATVRLPGESLTCFSIRLESLADKIPNSTIDTRAVMVRSKFLSALSQGVLRQLNVAFGSRDDARLADLVRMATILEDDSVESNIAVSASAWPVAAATASGIQDVRCFGCGTMGHYKNQCPDRKPVLCFKCNQEGHIARNCRQTSNPKLTGSNRVPTPNTESVPINNNASNLCGYCGQGYHAMIECDQFKARFLACVWCGAVEHLSHACRKNPANSVTNPAGNGPQSEW